MRTSIVVLMCALLPACGTSTPEPHAPPVVRQTLLLQAISRHDLAAVTRLLQDGADPNGDTMSLLAPAAEAGDDAIVAALLTAGADPNEAKFRRPDSGDTALFNATRRGYTKIAARLIDAGADPNRRQGHGGGWTPLCWAVTWGRAGIVEKLVASKADVDARCVTAASGESGQDVAERLAKPGHGRTPLMLAAQVRDPNIVRILLAAGSNPAAVDEHGQSALAYALKSDHPVAEIVRALSDAGKSLR